MKSRTCYYFHDRIKFEDFDFGNILLDEKSYKDNLIYDVSYKILIGAKPLYIKFCKVDGLVRDYDGTKCLVLFSLGKNVTIYDRIKYLTALKRGITYMFFLIIMRKSNLIQMMIFL